MMVIRVVGSLSWSIFYFYSGFYLFLKLWNNQEHDLDQRKIWRHSVAGSHCVAPIWCKSNYITSNLTFPPFKTLQLLLYEQASWNECLVLVSSIVWWTELNFFFFFGAIHTDVIAVVLCVTSSVLIQKKDVGYGFYFLIKKKCWCWGMAFWCFWCFLSCIWTFRRRNCQKKKSGSKGGEGWMMSMTVMSSGA